MRPCINLERFGVMGLSASSAAAYAGSAVSLGSALTLTQVGVLVGIVTAIGTFGLNAWIGYSKRQDEHEEHLARMRALDREEPAKAGRITPMSAATPKPEPKRDGER